MVPKPSSKSKATSFNGTLKFWVPKKILKKFQLFQKNSAHKGLSCVCPLEESKFVTNLSVANNLRQPCLELKMYWFICDRAKKRWAHSKIERDKHPILRVLNYRKGLEEQKNDGKDISDCLKRGKITRFFSPLNKNSLYT